MLNDISKLPPRVIPSLLLYDDVLVKTKKFKNPTYIGDPVNTINLFNKFEVDEIILLDIGCSKKKLRPNFSLIKELASECWVPLTYGGGISSVDDAREILNSGVEKVLFESLIYRSPSEIRECVAEFGSSSVVACLNIQKNIFGNYDLRTVSNYKKAPCNLERAIDTIRDLGVGEVVVNNISRDGTREGYDLDLLSMISSRFDCPVVALGGASKVSDFKEGIDSGAHAVSAGSYFVFQNAKNNSVLVNFPKREEIEVLFDE